MQATRILAIQFKYFGDAVFMTPALKALKDSAPNAELHVLVAAEIAPLLENISWITKVWAMPRARGKAKLAQSIPFIKALRKTQFDRCVDFGGNDRGAWLSWLCGAKSRLGMVHGHAKLLQKLAYTQSIQYNNLDQPHADLHFNMLALWGITKPAKWQLYTGHDARLVDAAQHLLRDDCVIAHIATSQPKKDWPLAHWVKLHQLCTEKQIPIVFSAGTNARETTMLNALKAEIPQAKFLAPIVHLPLFLAVLKRAKAVVAGDTGPLHFAAGLQVPTLGIFAVGNSLSQAAPMYKDANKLTMNACACYAEYSHLDYCKNANPCIQAITPEAVFAKLCTLLAQK